jgi:hypothetical protein
MDLDATSATLIAALVAALASTLGLALRIRADSRAELRRAYRGRLEPILEEIGDALHKIVACSVLAVRDKETENRRYFDSKKREAREVLRRLRPRVRYQLWGLDDGFKTLIALPDCVSASNRTGKGSRSLAQPGTDVNLYKRDGEDFWRYRFRRETGISRPTGCCA